MKVKKYVEIEAEVVARVDERKRIPGSFYRDKATGRLTFEASKAKPRKRHRDKIIRYLEHGWVKESTERIKVYESLPKEIGTPRMMSALDREMQEAKNALIDREIIDRV